ncbi:MAG: hypothetical protein KDD10_22235 [Phaeodactylibacter sp.]|nr:hypothetical protein [Phaeodactylibacter sp.]
MKYMLSTILCLCLFALQAQEQETSPITVSVVLKEVASELSPAQQEKLRNKVTQILSREGVAAAGWAQDFIVYPKLDINDEKQMSGMRQQTYLKADLTLIMEQTSNRTIFASTTQTLTGNGDNREAAITRLISNIKSSSPKYAEFIAQGKARIAQYYDDNCGQFLKKSESYAQLQDYGSALVELWQIPVAAEGCYDQAQAKMADVFVKLQEQNCMKGIQSARAEIAAQRYGKALEYLTTIDPYSPCFKEAQQLVTKVEGKVSDLEKRNWDLLMTAYKDEVALKKRRIDAAVEIARAYARKEPDNLYYNLIVK